MPSRIEIRQNVIAYGLRLDDVWVHHIVKCALTKIKKTTSPISIVFVTPVEIRKLNRIYRGKDVITDVLSFTYSNIDMPSTKDDFFGEIAVCLSRAKKQAHLFHNTYHEEVARLLVHGVLHLFGYDHETKKEATVMFGLTDTILKNIKPYEK